MDSLRGRPFLRTGSNLLSLPLAGSITTGLLGSVPIPFPPPTFPKKDIPTPFKSAGSGQILRASADPNSVTNWGAIFAMSTLSLVPVLLIFIFFQRFLVQGISTTGIKG